MVATAIYSVTMVLWKETTFPLQSHGKALEKECCLPGVFCDSGDTPANLLCELNGHLMPSTSCFYGKWVKDVCAGQFGVFVYLVLGALLRQDSPCSLRASTALPHTQVCGSQALEPNLWATAIPWWFRLIIIIMIFFIFIYFFNFLKLLLLLLHHSME